MTSYKVHHPVTTTQTTPPTPTALGATHGQANKQVKPVRQQAEEGSNVTDMMQSAGKSKPYGGSHPLRDTMDM